MPRLANDLAPPLLVGELRPYARARAVSLNTVYTHLRRIKEKTGSHRLPELIHKINDVKTRLRSD